MTNPTYLILSSPRSRTAWLSKFLSYSEWHCGHDELQYCRSFDDISSWLSQPQTGTVETFAAPWWRLIEKLAPDCKIVVLRRPVQEVVDSFMSIPGVSYDRERLTQRLDALDRKLMQIKSRIECLYVDYHDLVNEQTCARIFEYCLPYKHDHKHWRQLSEQNIQIDVRAQVRYVAAFSTQMERLGAQATRKCKTLIQSKAVHDHAGMTYQTEDFDTWLKDATDLFENHLVLVGEGPGDWSRKNLSLMRKIDQIGAMQIMTARCNGKMFGYLMTLISPSLASPSIMTATNTTFFASPDAPGVGLKLQRAALAELQKRGIDEVFMEAGNRGDGPRLDVLYKRLGAAEHSKLFRLDMEKA